MNAKSDKGIGLLDEEEPPPPYSYVDIDLSAEFSNLNLSTTSSKFPSEDECIAHLQLLEAFYQLKEDIVSSDGLFGIHDDLLLDGISNETGQEILKRKREKRWVIFVSKAVKRFQIWFQNQIQPSAPMFTLSEMAELNYRDIATSVRPLEMTADRLPPLDVLMVWHSFMLNPRTYMSDCIRIGKMSTWAFGLPWVAINSVIDCNTMAYEPSKTAKAAWFAFTHSPWNPLEGTDNIIITCSRCGIATERAWTTVTNSIQFTADAKSAKEGRGYADPGFIVVCKCGTVINHDTLRCSKFLADLENLTAHDVPMPGTLLSVDGTPNSFMILDSSKSGTHDIIFPNQLLRDGGLALAFGDSKNPKIWSPAHIRHWFQNAMLKDTTHLSATLKNFDTSAKPELRPHQRMSFRKLMACYWDNSSFFSMDLVGAVIRQGVFVAKMHDIDWLHSPALHLTMQRLIAKYERFFKILAKYPKNMAVPTLDLDLGWHTHQLSPQAYYNYSTSTTKNVFIDHNDKIADSKLSQSFEWTSKMYQRLFGELYSECTCWYCEAIRESSRGHPLTRVFSVGKKGIESQLRQLDKVSSSTNPAQALHISAHNAINTTGHSDFESMTRINEQKLERAYQCACTQAKKVGRAPPKREAYVTRHGYYPYAAYPYCTPLHVTTPACSTPSPGAVGDCCAGTCVGGVAMGSCVAGWYCGSIADCGGGVGLGQFGGGCAKPLTHDEMFGMCG